MVEAARAGGAVALEHYRRDGSVTLKADRSPVTEADREAERAILDVLRARYPDHGALGEELGEEGPRERRFIVDPIDGTRNFVRRIPTWGVLIGLEEAGQVMAGVVYQPVTGVLHTAWRGQGAWRDGERIRVSPVDALDRALVVHSSMNFLRKSRYWDGFLRLADRTQVQRGFGDFSAYLWVAEGQGEIAFSTTVKAWDVAALKVLVEEAGGRLTDLDGARRDLRHDGPRQQWPAARRGARRDERRRRPEPRRVACGPRVLRPGRGASLGRERGGEDLEEALDLGLRHRRRQAPEAGGRQQHAVVEQVSRRCDRAARPLGVGPAAAIVHQRVARWDGS